MRRILACSLAIALCLVPAGRSAAAEPASAAGYLPSDAVAAAVVRRGIRLVGRFGCRDPVALALAERLERVGGFFPLRAAGVRP